MATTRQTDFHRDRGMFTHHLVLSVGSRPSPGVCDFVTVVEIPVITHLLGEINIPAVGENER